MFSAGVDGVPMQFVQRFRPTFVAPIGESERWSMTATIEAGVSEGRHLQTELRRTLGESDLTDPEFVPGLDQSLFDLAGCEWPTKPANDLLRVDGVEDYLAVDRLFVDAYSSFGDFRVGRQSVQWGSALLVNPTDPFPEVLLLEPWKPRSGINAARGTLPIGERHQVQLLAGSDDSFLHPRLASRAVLNALETDFSAVAAYRGETDEGLIGMDVRGTLGVGFWFEGAWHVRADPYEELALGIDYTLPVFDLFLIAAQYHRNGAGSATAPDPTSRFAEGVEPPDCDDDLPFFEAGATDPYLSVFGGRDYGLLTTRVSFSREWAISALAVQNLGDGTGMAVPTASFFPAGWSEISLAAQVPYKAWGEGGEFLPRRRDLVLRTLESPLLPVAKVDFGGLLPKATVILWTRASF